ncbi:MAG: sensor histidine kinase [Candidatus Nanopelagicales bacterium]|nr:sensor histidine kinase [Candidatus Nanopelagicales bacterium]
MISDQTARHGDRAEPVGAESADRAREGDKYLAAHELLSQLAQLSRALPAGLDEIRLAQVLLEQIALETPYDRAAFYSVNDLDHLVPVTTLGADHLKWESRDVARSAEDLAPGRSGRTIDLTPKSQPASARPNSGPNPGSFAAILPAWVGDRRIGVAVIERDNGPWTVDQLAAAERTVADAAIQLDAGRLFSDVRALATAEERRRLAREIHDGVAQEIASLGYQADDIAAGCPDPRTEQAIRALRRELSRVVTELRLSIFDLRADVQADGGLGAALSSHVRQVGAASGLTVHLVLDESSRRLGSAAETELFRIAQEAITNARRHSSAENLWVTCRVHPPQALLRVADDGQGLGSARIDSYGLDIMQERARRMGAQFTVRDREGGGTVVEVVSGIVDR